MARRTSPEAYRQLVETARETIPGVAITTDVIVGFPGESEQEFAESLAFVRSMDFAGGHVFTYSENPLTPATKLPNPVPHPLRKERNARMREVLDESTFRYQRRFLGLQVPVLWEKQFPLDGGGYLLEGHTDNYLRVSTLSPAPLRGTFSSVVLEETGKTAMKGRLVGDEA
jgi:threonylcarbamoyladenosine tRNA methylthiotransferase MtaB